MSSADLIAVQPPVATFARALDRYLGSNDTLAAWADDPPNMLLRRLRGAQERMDQAVWATNEEQVVVECLAVASLCLLLHAQASWRPTPPVPELPVEGVWQTTLDAEWAWAMNAEEWVTVIYWRREAVWSVLNQRGATLHTFKRVPGSTLTPRAEIASTLQGMGYRLQGEPLMTLMTCERCGKLVPGGRHDDCTT
jgi:hypothetical protein